MACPSPLTPPCLPAPVQGLSEEEQRKVGVLGGGRRGLLRTVAGMPISFVQGAGRMLAGGSGGGAGPTAAGAGAGSGAGTAADDGDGLADQWVRFLMSQAERDLVVGLQQQQQLGGAVAVPPTETHPVQHQQQQQLSSVGSLPTETLPGGRGSSGSLLSASGPQLPPAAYLMPAQLGASGSERFAAATSPHPPAAWQPSSSSGNAAAVAGGAAAAERYGASALTAPLATTWQSTVAGGPTAGGGRVYDGGAATASSFGPHESGQALDGAGRAIYAQHSGSAPPLIPPQQQQQHLGLSNGGGGGSAGTLTSSGLPLAMENRGAAALAGSAASNGLVGAHLAGPPGQQEGHYTQRPTTYQAPSSRPSHIGPSVFGGGAMVAGVDAPSAASRAAASHDRAAASHDRDPAASSYHTYYPPPQPKH